MAIRRKGTLIPRYDFPMVRRSITTSVVDSDNPFSNSTESIGFLRGEALSCTIQNLSSWEMNTVPEGMKTSSVFNIFSNTPLFSAKENTKELSDAIYIPDSFFELNGIVVAGVGGWFVVTKTSIRNTGVISHCQSLIMKDDYLLNQDNIPQYPDTTTLDSEADTRVKLLSGGWLLNWEALNV